MMKIENAVKQVAQFGQSIWYDGLVSKEAFQRMIEEDGIRGGTTNPTIFEKAFSSGATGVGNAEEIYKQIAVKAVQEVADTFLPVYHQTRGQDGFISLEVSPLLAYDTTATIREAQELYARVARENIMIKVPATRQGLPAIEALIAEGISVNVTLIFSLSRYKEVMQAYLSGLEKRASGGLELSRTASVASFFVSRVDTAVDKILSEKRILPELMGKVAIANSKCAYQEFEKVFFGAPFQKLKSLGAQVQRPLWASTGTKNPNLSDVLYIESLMGPQTVNTVPPATLDAFRDHGVAASRLKEGAEEACEILEKCARSGIDLAAITQELEDAGVKLFADSYNKIIERIAANKK